MKTALPHLYHSQEWLSLCQHLLAARPGCAGYSRNSSRSSLVEGDEGKIFIIHPFCTLDCHAGDAGGEGLDPKSFHLVPIFRVMKFHFLRPENRMGASLRLMLAPWLARVEKPSGWWPPKPGVTFKLLGAWGRSGIALGHSFCRGYCQLCRCLFSIRRCQFLYLIYTSMDIVFWFSFLLAGMYSTKQLRHLYACTCICVWFISFLLLYGWIFRQESWSQTMFSIVTSTKFKRIEFMSFCNLFYSCFFSPSTPKMRPKQRMRSPRSIQFSFRSELILRPRIRVKKEG